MLMFLLGFYCAGAIATFLVVFFFVGLGGRNEDCWKPFVYAPLWPILIPYRILRLRR